MKVLIACGGTGGHLFPGLAVAEALLARRHQVRLLVSEKAVDQTALKTLAKSWPDAKLDVQASPAVGYNGARRLVHFCWRLARATREAAAICEAFGPDAVLGMGGFTSPPAVMAARWRRAPAVIHESNAVPGKANRWAGRFASHVAVGVAACARYFRRRPITVTGTPLRSQLRGGRIADAREQLGLAPARLTTLVVGGSQGARALNEALVAAMPWLDDWADRIQFLHLSGARDEQCVRDAYLKNGLSAVVTGFCARMELAYSAADLVIARAGAATLTEIAAFGLPAILAPYPHATDNHQWHNARVFEQAGAARLLDTASPVGLHAVAGERLAGVIIDLLGDQRQREGMSAAARSLAVPDAAERMVNLLERYAG
jgi:UDP-N-acetylglucosamine--N-acetylmuramyl-(pentapeptide) pyrophosphoryl-undecaprenol N-acetylglucosamine transferase